MWHKTDSSIPKLVWASLNQQVSFMNMVEMHKSLPKRTRLHTLVSNLCSITQEIIQEHTDVPKVHWSLRHWIQDCNRQIIIAPWHMPNHNTTHDWSTVDHLTLGAPW
jgi:hypothetical protein